MVSTVTSCFPSEIGYKYLITETVLSNAPNEAIEDSKTCLCGASREQFGGLSDEGHVAVFF